MSIHLCPQYPCPICQANRGALTAPNYAPTWFTSTITYPLAADREFFTFAEAIRVAHDEARRAVDKVRVHWHDGRWHVTWRYHPVLINGQAAS